MLWYRRLFLEARKHFIIFGMGTNPEPEEVVWITDGKGAIVKAYSY